MNFHLKRAACVAYAAGVINCFLPIPAAAADEATIRAVVDASIRPLMAEHDVPGMAVAVTVDGRTIFLNYGVASREHGTAVSEATLFELGSITKLFTGTLALYAQELGALSIDDHPGQYVSELKGAPIDKATLLHLGTYTAGGLPLQFPAEVEDHGSMLAYFKGWTPDAAPGQQRRYSNPSIGLLGYVTGLAMGTGFPDAVEARLLPALGMSDSYIRVPEEAAAHYAWGYSKANMPVRVNPGVFADEAYGVKSTAADMIRFVQANIDPAGLEAPLARAISGTHAPLFDVGAMTQGLGWEQYAWPTRVEQLLDGNSHAIIWEPNPAKARASAEPSSRAVLLNKTGSTNGFGAYVALVPTRKIGIVMLANRNYPIPARVRTAHTILEQLATDGH